MKNFIFRMLGILAFGATFVPAYYTDKMIGDCIDPEYWTTAHTHPQMLYALLWFAGAYPLLLLGIKHGLFVDTEKGAPSWLKSSAWAMFWVTPALFSYADDLRFGCPYTADLQIYILWSADVLILISLILIVYVNRKEKAAEKKN